LDRQDNETEYTYCRTQSFHLAVQRKPGTGQRHDTNVELQAGNNTQRATGHACSPSVLFKRARGRLSLLLRTDGWAVVKLQKAQNLQKHMAAPPESRGVVGMAASWTIFQAESSFRETKRKGNLVVGWFSLDWQEDCKVGEKMPSFGDLHRWLAVLGQDPRTKTRN